LKPKVETLWENYRSDPSAIAPLMEFYSDLVRTNAMLVSKQLPKHIELDDLISEGYFGLADAISKFDPDYGFKFETYASFRIKGSIRDQLRGSDWAPRSLRSKAKEVETASVKLAAELNREPTVEEIANLLDWKVEEIHDISGRTFRASFTNLDDVVNIDGDGFSLSDLLPDKEAEPTSDLSQLQSRLITVLQSLTEQHSTVLALYYVQGLSLKDIGDIMGVTESRACQVHTDALEALWVGCLPD
jgi:RNA polymerase sigma factor for flagellar operon FliA